jgi:hypothetical protein
VKTTMSTPDFQLRFVEIRGVRYVRLNDVTALIRELGSTEETDVRERLNEAARRIARVEGK